jgi:glycosyltransferase involved in cell wall biosynthesis
MCVVHLLRKCDPAEWGGTETALHRLLEGLRLHEVSSVVFCPRLSNGRLKDPLTEAGWPVRRFKAFLPIWGLSEKHKRQLIAVGGNLLSFDLLPALRREPDVDVVHTHTLGRLGATALNAAKWRRLPFVVSIHGGLADLPEAVTKAWQEQTSKGWEWGKIFSLLLRTRRFLDASDLIVACNEKEAVYLRGRYPTKRIRVQPHGVPAAVYAQDHREEARTAFPQIRDRPMLLLLGRIDPAKNQVWVIAQAKAIFQRHPQALVVLAGACTDLAYGDVVKKNVLRLGLESRVLLTGGLPPGDPRLIGLLQEAKAVILPSLAETFGLVILEAWAAGTPVIASKTFGASALIKDGYNGWLFDLTDQTGFHRAIDAALLRPELAKRLGAAGRDLVSAEYDATLLAGRMKNLYQQLIEEKHALRHSTGRRYECVDPG